MPYITVHSPAKEIPIYNECMNIYQARNELKWVLNHKCIDCDMQCSDCYLHYKEKIALEKILQYLNNKNKTITGVKTIKNKGRE